MLIAVQTTPGNSWASLAEWVMTLLNLALQNVALELHQWVHGWNVWSNQRAQCQMFTQPLSVLPRAKKGVQAIHGKGRLTSELTIPKDDSQRKNNDNFWGHKWFYCHLFLQVHPYSWSYPSVRCPLEPWHEEMLTLARVEYYSLQGHTVHLSNPEVFQGRICVW